MENRPNRQERVQARQEKRDDKEQARLRGLTLEGFREQRDKHREAFEKEQEAKLSAAPYKMKLDSNLQLEGNITIKAWEGDYKFLRNMIEAAYLKVNSGDSAAREKSQAIVKTLQSTLGTDLIKTEGTLIKMAGNQLSLIGAMTGNGVAIEKASPPDKSSTEEAIVIDQYGRTRVYGTETEPSNQETGNLSITPGGPIKDEFYQDDDGTWRNRQINREEKEENAPEQVEKQVKKEALAIRTGNWVENPISFQIDIERHTLENGETHYFVDGAPWGHMSEGRFKRLLAFNSIYKDQFRKAGVNHARMLELDSV